MSTALSAVRYPASRFESQTYVDLRDPAEFHGGQTLVVAQQGRHKKDDEHEQQHYV